MSQISRLKDTEISNGNLINADDLDAELNQLVNESNSQDSRITTLEGFSSARIPTGGLIPYAGSAAPSGFLLCAGQAVSRTTFAALFTAIGTTYGAGDGSTTFNLPDLRGRTVIALDNMGGTAANRITSASTNGGNASTLGGTGGTETHTLTVSEMPSHNHSSVPNVSSFTVNSGTSTSVAVYTLGNTGSTGGSAAHSNTQPWLALNYLIKT